MTLMTRLGALRELLARHADALREARAGRRQTDARHYLAYEADFLPAALALREKPVSVLPRATMWTLMALAELAVLWAVFGRVDVVATAQGKLIPSDRTKVIQPVETAAVVAIHVSDGDNVRAGDVLIELDATAVQADRDRIANDLRVERMQVARARAMLESLEKGRAVDLDVPEGVTPAESLEARTHLSGQFAEYEARMARINAEIERHAAEMRSTRALVTKLEQTVPIARQRARDFEALADKQFVSRHSYLEREQFRIEQEADLAAQRGRLGEIAAASRQAERQRAELAAQTRRIHLDGVNEGGQKVTALAKELVKAEMRERLMRLVAPVDGTIQQLAVHTVGGVVTPAQALMAIVPKDNPVEIEAFLENKDVGFVHVGQAVEVKVETFQYTKYGTVPGKVISISDDAIRDEKRGLIYAARIGLARSSIGVDGKALKLSSGMAVTAEIKTGRRRVIEYFLSPLMQYKAESLRER